MSPKHPSPDLSQTKISPMSIIAHEQMGIFVTYAACCIVSSCGCQSRGFLGLCRREGMPVVSYVMRNQLCRCSRCAASITFPKANRDCSSELLSTCSIHWLQLEFGISEYQAQNISNSRSSTLIWHMHFCAQSLGNI